MMPLMDTPTTGVATPIETPSELLTVIQSSSLEPATAQGLLDSYRPIFIEAHDLLAKAKGVAEAVTDATRVTEIRAAHVLRMQLKEVRLKGDKLREQLKQDSLRRGNAIQGVFNVLKYMVEPVEEALKHAEQIAERAEAARKLALKTEREAALAPYGVDVSFYALAEMPVAAFDQLLANTKAAHEAAKAAALKAEADRLAKEKADAEERERVRAENERLKKEAEEKEAALKVEREKAAKEAAEREAALAAERARVAKEQAEAAAAAKAELDRREALAAAERKQAEEAAAEIRRVAAENAAKAAEVARKEREALEAKATAERAAREKLEAEQAAARQAEADRIAAEQEAARKAAAAPDKEKLRAFAEQLWGMKLPELTTEGGIAVLATLKTQHEKYIAWITKQSEAL